MKINNKCMKNGCWLSITNLEQHTGKTSLCIVPSTGQRLLLKCAISYFYVAPYFNFIPVQHIGWPLCKTMGYINKRVLYCVIFHNHTLHFESLVIFFVFFALDSAILWNGLQNRLKKKREVKNYNSHYTWSSLTLSGQHSDADARVTEFNEGRVARFSILFADEKDVFCTHIPMC